MWVSWNIRIVCMGANRSNTIRVHRTVFAFNANWKRNEGHVWHCIVCVCVWECDRNTLLPANANSQSVVKLINNIILSCRFSIPIMCVLSLFSDSLALLVVYIYCIFYSCLLSCPSSDIVLHHNCSRLRIRTIKCRSFDVTYEVITSISRWYNCTWNNKWNRSLSMHFDRHSPLHTIYPSLPEQFFVQFGRISIKITSI